MFFRNLNAFGCRRFLSVIITKVATRFQCLSMRWLSFEVTIKLAFQLETMVVRYIAYLIVSD